MSIPTPWGYDILTTEPLPDIISPTEFDAATGKKYTRDQRLAPALRAASATIRNRCGWHLYPSIPCRFETSFYSPAVKRNGTELLIQLPARLVTSIEGIKIDGLDADFFTLERNGLLHVYALPFVPIHKSTPIVIDYTAGLTDQQAADIKDIAASRATHGLTSTAGVQSEAAGGVSVTYSAAWAQGGGAGALSDIDKETLAVWTLKGVY